MDRREFLETGGGILLVGLASAGAARLLTRPPGRGTSATAPETGRRWGMVIDLTKCRPGCTKCLEACRTENNVAHHDDKRWDVHWIRKANLTDRTDHEDEGRPVILLCNHCDKPPCAQVCPVQATYKRHDGIVIVDHHRCIGCRYCVVACPYNARYFNFKEGEWPNKEFPRRTHGVAEACTLCAHRLAEDKPPACVEACAACGANALCVGDLNDPESEVSQLIAHHPTNRIRPDLGTEPKVYYIGL
jgi:molybdopterin-containing oxidoreductase family iron-sulfur binding subunit